MSSGRICYLAHPEYLACLDAKKGDRLWKNSDRDLLEAIGPHYKAQIWIWGFSSTCYAKCSDTAIYFAGPTRTRLVAASTEDGRLLWSHPVGNYQLVLRDEGLYALGSDKQSRLFEPMTGKVLQELPCRRAACTRATGTIDSIFTRGEQPPDERGRHAGTMRLSMDDRRPRRIALMRPPCQDGVMIAHGLLYWGPWMCDCHLQLVGQLCLAPAGDFDFEARADEAERLQVLSETKGLPPKFEIAPGDWPTYRADNQRRAATEASIPARVARAWVYTPPQSKKVDSSLLVPAAPVTAGGMVFVCGPDGAVRALDGQTGEPRWKAFTGGRITYPCAIADDRMFLGSGDGFVYAFEAATGHPLWRFRAAPVERKIVEHGRLISTWPVGSGVAVDEGVVYAAAGLASWDGTHVYALDAASGRIRWQNNATGHLAGDDKVSGVSVQGHTLLHDGKLYLAGGNVVSPAVYDTRDGKCLNTLDDEWSFSPRGCELVLAGGNVGVFGTLLYSPREPARGPWRLPEVYQAQQGEAVVRAAGGPLMRIAAEQAGSKKPRALWTSTHFGRIRAVALGENAAVAAGQFPSADPEAPGRHAVAAFDLEDGTLLWSHDLDGVPLPWGVALDRDGRVITALLDGRMVCLANQSAN